MTRIKLLLLYRSLIIFFVIFLSINSFPQGTQKSYKILGISVEGNKSADATTIIANSGLKVGSEIQVPGDQTLSAIRQLWTLNIFSDIQILIEREISEGVFLLIKVEEYPRLEKVVIEGNDEIDTEDIESKVTFLRGTVISPQSIAKLKLRIKDLYAEEGFLNAEIKDDIFEFVTADTVDDEITVYWRNKKDFSDEYNFTYESSDLIYSNLIERIKDRVLLKLTINEGNEVVVREIDFSGNTVFDSDELAGEMEETSIAKWWKFWSSAQFKPKEFEKDKQLVVDFYKKNGYRDAEILSDSLDYFNDNKDLKILINVYEGPQYMIRNITWEGNTVYPDYVLNERLDFAKGDVYDYEKFQQNLRGNEAQTDISALYLDNGYLTFNAQAEEKRVSTDSIDIHIRVEERNQFRVSRVEIEGNTKTKDKVIRRELYTIPGDYFNRAFLFRSVQQLANLQYFSAEKLYGPGGIDTRLESDSTVAVVFNVEEKSSDYLNASVGYSGAFGFSGSIGVTLTNFSITEPFSLGGGQILNFNWQFGFGNIYRTFTVGFTEPWMFDTPTSAGVDVFDTRQQYVYDLRQTGATLRVGRRLKWPDDFFYVQGRFRYQYNNVIEGQQYYQEGVTHQYTLGATFSRRNIDNPIFPSQGSSYTLDLEISGGPFLPGDVDYHKNTFKAEWYKRLFNTNRLVFYTVADFGYIDEIVKGTPIQPFEFFYMGGNGLVISTVSLRGYPDRSVGPRNVFGQVIGGRVFDKIGAELRFAVTLEPIPLYLLTFAEAGNVFESFDKTDIFDMRRSAGVGARILINPIGLIGFDFGYGFDRKIVDGRDPEWLFHFQFGKGF
ncbi:MAG: outer membrane protein assembly factor BamA [Ignavibacteriota bacterium]|nr:MAG: outer membrane protein assembly factor BamA [Chlorobiota bacterium]MBE7476369.1 outer membrane protein assembly factor BamA [Ignavibacteriales bacterium]MBL1124352.1 outer membrane protein assembly factor BamA [Ignavibacteriota bacterium]MCE7855437.1 outer membrane protein assembly factor BamA [Ignavibacteria bacterium CHB3]QKJ97943.1 MAG: outer membrane protein assembly factor BamA [Ignavibacteriota bacterium]